MSPLLIKISKDLKHEIFWKAMPIAFHCAIQRLCFDAIDRSKIGIEHYALTANFVNELTKVVNAESVLGRHLPKKDNGNAENVKSSVLKLLHCPHSLAPTLVTLPSMSRVPRAPFTKTESPAYAPASSSILFPAF